MRKNSIKNHRVNDAVLRELSAILAREIKDPRIAPLTSVTEVQVAPDLKTCKVMISVLGDDETKQKTMEGLRSSGGYIRHLLAQNLNMRNTPELLFRLDNSIEYGVRMSRVIDDLVEQESAQASGQEESTDSGVNEDE